MAKAGLGRREAISRGGAKKTIVKRRTRERKLQMRSTKRNKKQIMSPFDLIRQGGVFHCV